MTDPDRTLVRRARRGDGRAWETIYERHRRPLLGYLIGIVGERRLAEDVFQEAWIKVVEGIDRFQSARGTFRSWLYRVAGNAAIDRLRRERVRATAELDAPTGDGDERRIDRVRSEAPGPDREGAGRAFARALEAALRQLPERQRLAVLLRHRHELSYAEIAATLGAAEGTAKTLVHRGVLALRRELREWDDDGSIRE